MKRSLSRRAPVISLLSPSPASSRRAADRLAGWTNLQRVLDVEASPESLNSVFRSSFLPKLKWDSIALECPETGTILHWLSLESKSVSMSMSDSGSDTDTDTGMDTPHELLAVQDVSGVTQACQKIATKVGVSASVPYVCMSHAMGRPISVHKLLASGLPFLHFGEEQDKAPRNTSSTVTLRPTTGCLKEIVIPAYDDETDRDGLTLLSKCAHASSLARPCTGLYQFKDASQLCLRPLPAAKEDRRLPPPSLVFHTDSVDRIEELALAETTATAKIGFTGTVKGQIMVQTADWAGLDVRFCQATKYSSMFAEAQESLLAGSLPELQSPDVLQGGSGKKKDGDCWGEFRANLRHPTGFLQPARQQKIARAPDLPYE